ncbi:MAG: hypothetical protein KDC87_00765, partial [Planctomycetes bacterium]|nr:hypothetical protein [Planctomycetota bacterium]
MTVPRPTSCVTIHMVASLDGYIARRDGRVDWLDTSDHFEGGATMDPEFVAEFLQTIDCYVMGSRTYETALGFAVPARRESPEPSKAPGRLFLQRAAVPEAPMSKRPRPHGGAQRRAHPSP